MAGVSKTILIGNLGADPESKYLPNGDAVTNFSLATSESFKDKQTGERREITEWHRCVAFGKPAEIIAQYAAKGSKLYVEGQNKTRKWQDQSGQDRYMTEVKVREFQFLDSKGGDSQPSKPAQQPSPSYQAQHPAPQYDPNDPPF